MTLSFNAFGKSKIQKKLEKDFVDAYCNCLERHASQEPDKILYNVTETCVRNFVSDEAKIKEIEQAVKREREISCSESISVSLI